MPRNQDPIRKITTSTGEIKYRFVIDMGKRPDGGRDQRCFTFTKYQEARAKRASIIAARQSKTLIKPTKTRFDELAQQWLDSRHDVREVTRLGYEYVLKPVRTRDGPPQGSGLVSYSHREADQDFSAAGPVAPFHRVQLGNDQAGTRLRGIHGVVVDQRCSIR
jgi:hypothetical protein